MRQLGKWKKFLKELQTNKYDGVSLLKSSKRFYADDTVMRRLAAKHSLNYDHTKNYKHYWLTEFAPKDSKNLIPTIDRRVRIHNKKVATKIKRLTNKTDSLNKNQVINVVIDFNYWILLVILFLMLLLK